MENLLQVRRVIKAFISLLFLLFLPFYPVQASSDCADLLSSNETGRSQPQSVEELFLAFTQGLLPDLSNANQRMIFRLYRKLRFGNPDTSLNRESSEMIAETLKTYPNLRDRKSFRSYHMQAQELSYLVPDELIQFLSSQFKSVGQVKSNLFQVRANVKYWRRVLGNDHFPEDLSEFVKNKTIPINERAVKLYKFMDIERKKMLKEGLPVKNISQAMVDLIHTIGYQDKDLYAQLKSSDGMERLKAFKSIISARDTFAMELGFEGHFAQVLQELDVVHPTGLTEESKLTSLLEFFEEKVVAGAQDLGQGEKVNIRHLSLIESPFRSCLGGSDCSSSTYLTKALDPNYHYFTLTDSKGYSNGHVTVVLGTAISEGREIKVAFIDKVQNVDNSDIPAMLEGIRRSVKEQDYLLALPGEMGDHNGISNYKVTRNFLKNGIQTSSDQVFKEFTPHSHSFRLSPGYSRAYMKLLLKEILPLEASEVIFQRGEITTPRQLPEINLYPLIQNMIDLKNGNVQDKIRYISLMPILEKEGLETDPEFSQILQKWIQEPQTNFRLKKHIFVHELRTKNKDLSNLLSYFDERERINLIQNLMDTPRYKKMLIYSDQLFQLAFALSYSPNHSWLILKEEFQEYSPHSEKLFNDLPQSFRSTNKHGIKMKDFITLIIEASRELKEDGLLLYLARHTFREHGVEMKEQISQMIEASLEIKATNPLSYLTEYTFPKHAVELKEQISQTIEASLKMKNAWILSILAKYTFPIHGVELKEQISQAIKASLKMNAYNTLDYLAEYTFPKHAVELKEQMSQMIDASLRGRRRRSLMYLAKHTFPIHGVELKEQISQVIKASLKMNAYNTLDYLAEYTFPRHGVELKEQISQMIEASLRGRQRRFLMYLAKHTFPIHGVKLKEQISQMIEASLEMKDYEPLENLAIYTFPIHAVELKEQVFQVIVALTKFKRKDAAVVLQRLTAKKIPSTNKELAITVDNFLSNSSSREAWNTFKAEVSNF